MLYKALSVLVFSLSLLIADKGIAAEKRHAEGHVHGVAEINIIVEGKKVVVEFRTPTEGLMGFEHEARSDAEKRKLDAAMKLVSEKFNDLVIFEKNLGCLSRPGNAAVVQSDSSGGKDSKQGQGEHKKSGEHREVRATYHIECQKDPTNSRVRFGVTKMFPDVHELKVQVLSDAKQTGATIKKDQGDVRL